MLETDVLICFKVKIKEKKKSLKLQKQTKRQTNYFK